MAGTQSSLFEIHRDQLTPTPSFPRLARRTDPETSHRAALEMETSGQLKSDMMTALEAVREFPHRTATELEALIGCRDGKVRKRLAQLRRLGLIIRGSLKICPHTKRRCHTWEPVQ